MSVSRFTGLPVLVVSLLLSSQASAATPPTSPDLDDHHDRSPPATAEELDRARQVQLTPPPVKKESAREDDYFYRYRQSLMFRGGALVDSNQTNMLGSNIGFQYRFPFDISRRFEIGADLLNEGAGVLHASQFQFSDDSRLRWFSKYGVGIRVIPSQQLVTFLKLANWQARLGGGSEWTVIDPFSLRLEVEGAISTEKLTVIATVGFAYGW